MSALGVRREKRRRVPVGASPTRQPLQPEATGAVMEETKWLKPSVSVSRIGDSASVQAVTRVNAEQASKRTQPTIWRSSSSHQSEFGCVLTSPRPSFDEARFNAKCRRKATAFLLLGLGLTAPQAAVD